MKRKVTTVHPKNCNNASFSIKQCRSGEDYGVIADIGDHRFYAVYDGHGCDKNTDSLQDQQRHVAVYLKDRYHHHVAHAIEGVDINDVETVKSKIAEETIKLDRDLFTYGGTFGATVCAFLEGDEWNYVINLGDSRIVLFDSKGEVMFFSTEHKPLIEKDRILKAGGTVSKDDRVDGKLAMSRSIGDFDLKLDSRGRYEPNGKVSCHPDVVAVRKDSRMTLVLGTDGLFCPRVTPSIIKGVILKSTLKLSSEELLNYARKYNDDDDTTVIVAHI